MKPRSEREFERIEELKSEARLAEGIRYAGMPEPAIPPDMPLCGACGRCGGPDCS